MKQTAIQQAIVMVRSRMESMDETLMGKHTIHHLQQVERRLYELLDAEKEQILKAYEDGFMSSAEGWNGEIPPECYNEVLDTEEYYNETYEKQ
jgi:hypothetical protein